MGNRFSAPCRSVVPAPGARGLIEVLPYTRDLPRLRCRGAGGAGDAGDAGRSTARSLGVPAIRAAHTPPSFVGFLSCPGFDLTGLVMGYPAAPVELTAAVPFLGFLVPLLPQVPNPSADSAVPIAQDSVDDLVHCPSAASNSKLLKLFNPLRIRRSKQSMKDLPRNDLVNFSAASTSSSEKVLKMLSDIPMDSLYLTLLNVESYKDLVRIMFSAHWLYSFLSGDDFRTLYLQKNHSSPAYLSCLIPRDLTEPIVQRIQYPVNISFDFMRDTHMWNVVECRDGFVLAEDRYSSNHFCVIDLLRKATLTVPTPPAPVMQVLLAAGIVAQGNTWVVIALFGRPTRSISKNRQCWVGVFDPTTDLWTGYAQSVEFDLPIYREQLHSPSILTSQSYWNLLFTHRSIISVNIQNYQLLERRLPFVSDILHPVPHVLGKNGRGDLCLVVHDGLDLLVWNWTDSDGWEVYNTFPGFARRRFLGFAEANSLLILHDFMCFNINDGYLIPPFLIDAVLQDTEVCPFEMPWPPRPRSLA